MANQPLKAAALDPGIPVGVVATPGQGTITARKAGGLRDMALPVSPSQVPVAKALQNLAKVINLALAEDFLETELEPAYKAARVRKGTVEILHDDYIGLGDGVFAAVGKVGKSIQLTLRGPDPGSPEGKKAFAEQGGRSLKGVVDLIGRKLNLLQEYEDKVPLFVAQMLDRLEAANMVAGWDRNEWEIGTRVIGLDVVIRPLIVLAERV